MVARSCPASVAVTRGPGPRVLGASKIFRLARHCTAVHLRMDTFPMSVTSLRKLDYIPKFTEAEKGVEESKMSPRWLFHVRRRT